MRILPLAEVKARLSALVSEVELQHDQITITRNGAPAAMVVSVAEWESLQETLAVLSDPQASADLREAELSRAAGEVHSTDEVLTDFAARRSQSA
ncbi:MAG: type II toxin-antitoxin system Phd/YefM family antitoxin [Pseudonocardiaceae bacterium]